MGLAPLLALILPFVRPAMVKQARKYMVSKVPQVFRAATAANLIFFDSLVAGGADKHYSDKEKADLKAKWADVSENMPTLIDALH
jgi:hypothetical protein